MTSKRNRNHTTNHKLPKTLYYGRNLLALRHDASGVRLAFDAREKRLFFKMGRVDGVSRRWRIGWLGRRDADKYSFDHDWKKQNA